MDLAENLRAVSLEDNAILFSPQAHSQWRHVRLNPIPRYLFRVFTPKSDGHTDATVSRSRDASSGKQGWDEDIFATSAPVETARTIADHLWWRRRSDRADNLVSWTSSILFAVRYMFYRHYDPKDGSPLADINLLILDTSTFMGGTFIRDVDLIAAFKSFDNNDVQSLQAMARLRSRPEFYFGEYLSQGSLTMRGRCSYVSAATMISSGILELHHSFQQASQGFDREKWVKPVQGMRVSIRTVSTAEQASAELLERVLDCASAFEQCWQLPVTVQFLAILPFRLEKRVVYEKIYARMKPTESEFLRCATYWEAVHAPRTMPEMTRGKSIMTALCELRVRDLQVQAQEALDRIIQMSARNYERHSPILLSLHQIIQSVMAEERTLGQLF